jgi:hypothetical protein
MKQQNKILSIRIHEIINRKQVGQYTIVKLKKLDASLPTSLNQIYFVYKVQPSSFCHFDENSAQSNEEMYK